VLSRYAVGWRSSWEAFTILAALAEATRRVRIGTMVAATVFREPALLAKQAAAINEISGGRLVLGLGSGLLRAQVSD